MNIIRIEGLVIKGYHGVYPEERITGRDFRYDIEIKTQLIKGNTTDNIADTIDYVSVYQMVREIAQTPVNLMEHLASTITQAILNYSEDINQVKIKITKLQPPIDAIMEGVSVEMERSR
jgi:dihydroneopterin aldolase